MFRKYKMLRFFAVVLFFISTLFSGAQTNLQPVKNIITRAVGKSYADKVELKLIQNNKNTFGYKTANNKIYIEGNSPVSLTRGFYDYLKTTHQGMITWSGKNLQLKKSVNNFSAKTVTSPYQYTYYMNVVTHGYTTPYWDWKRWEQEIDWMALHGMNMLLINGTYEAIAQRVFQKIGMKDEAIKKYFCGPAFQPWNRMGNVTNWNNHFPDSWFTKQIALTHKILNRCKELGIHTIIPSFAGFVPKELKEVYPDADLMELNWVGFPKEQRSHILKPTSDLFVKIGKMYIEEWEKEYGKGSFYLADSFNEMEVPAQESEQKMQDLLTAYGDNVFKYIHEANPDATWVMQGWTFPYYKDKSGKLFWSYDRLHALVKNIPDDKLMFLDLANEYNKDFWKMDPSWKTYKGFFNKKWIYSFIPNMGGKIPWNGILKTYAEAPVEALQYNNKGNLVGFGFAPEGIENNEIIYELISDMAWRDSKIDLNDWIRNYCLQRYGSYSWDMKRSYELLQRSAYGTFTDHPRFRYQLSNDGSKPGSVNNSREFTEAVNLFLKNAQLKKNIIYRYDAIDLAVQYLSLRADEMLKEMHESKDRSIYEQKQKQAYELLLNIDRLLLSNPDRSLQKWVNYARYWGDNDWEKNYYEADAKRLITTWGGGLDEYAARVWGGLVGDYYAKRMMLHCDGCEQKADIKKWQEEWIIRPYRSAAKPFADPVSEAVKLVNQYK